MLQIPHNETLGTLLSKGYYDRYQIQNDGKYCQNERQTTKWNNSPWKSLPERGHFENKGLNKRPC